MAEKEELDKKEEITDVEETGGVQGEGAGADEKDYAKQEKAVLNLEQQLHEWMKEKREGQFILTCGQFSTEMNMKKTEEGYTLRCFGIDVLSIGKDNEIKYNKEGLTKLKQMMEKNSPVTYEELGLPEPEYLEHLEKEKAKEDGEKGDNKEKTEEEEDLPEEEKGEEKSPEDEEEAVINDIAREEKLDTDKIVELNRSGSGKVDKYNTAFDKIRGDYTHIYSVPCGEYVNQFKYVGVKKDGEHEEINTLKRTKGTNPTQEVIMLDKKGDDVEKGMLSEMYEVEGTNGREFFGVKKGAGGVEEHVFIRRTPGNNYVAIPIPQAHTRNIEMANQEVRELMTRELNDDNQLEAVAKKYYKLEELEKQGVPDEINPAYTDKGIQLEEITGEKAREDMKEGLQREYGFSERQAEETVKMVFDENVDFEKAIVEVQEETQEYEGRTPWGDAEDRRIGRR